MEASLVNYARPFVDKGPVVEAVKQRLIARAMALGWVCTRDMDLHLMTDGVRIEADADGDLARFIFPADAPDVRLRSKTFSPYEMGHTVDRRELGVMVKGLEVSDGLRTRRDIPLDHPALGKGFYGLECKDEEIWRWTNGEAVLPTELWAGCRDHVILRLSLDPNAGQVWIAPDTAGTPGQHTCAAA